MFLQNILKRKRVLPGASFKYSRRLRQRVDLPLVPTKVFMDLENIAFPKGSDKALVINNIKNTLVQKGYYVKSIRIYTCDDGRFSESYLRQIEGLEDLGVTLIRVEKDEDKRDDVDHLIKEHISSWKLHYQPPAAVLLLSSDGDYSDLVVATLRDGFEFFIGYDENRTKPEFAGLVKSSNLMLFKELAEGTLLQANGGGLPRPPSPPSPPIRNQPSVTQDNKLKVFWDIGSCPIPFGASAVKMKKNLEDMLQKSVYSMDAYGRPDKVPNSRVIMYLSNSGIKVNIVEAVTAPKQPGQGVPDEVIKMAIYNWCSTEDPHIPVLLITDDKRFASMFEDLTAKGFQISLAHTSEAPEELTRSAPQRYIWDQLVKTPPKQETVFGRARERTPSELHTGAGFTVEIPIGWEQEETHEDQEVFRLSDKFHSHLSVVVSPATVASMSGFGTPEQYYNQSEFRNVKLHTTAKKEYDGIEYFYFIASENEAHQVITATIHGGMLYICKAEEGNKGARKSAMDAATSFRVL